MEDAYDDLKTSIIESIMNSCFLNSFDIELCNPLFLCSSYSCRYDDFEFWDIFTRNLRLEPQQKKLLINFGTKDNVFNKVLCFMFGLPYYLERSNMDDNQEYFACHYSQGYTFPLISLNLYEDFDGIYNIIESLIESGVREVYFRSLILSEKSLAFLNALETKYLNSGLKIIVHVRYKESTMVSTSMKNCIFIKEKTIGEKVYHNVSNDKGIEKKYMCDLKKSRMRIVSNRSKKAKPI